MTKRAVVVIALVCALAGCSSDGDDPDAAGTVDTTTTSPPAATSTTTQSSGPVDVNVADFPVTPLTAPVDAPYASSSAQFDGDKLGVPAGTVFADWYATGDTWTVHFRGLTPEAATGKCLGTSLEVDNGQSFANVTNSPYGAAACEGFASKILPPGAVRLCRSTAVVYTTEIPLTAEGSLYASIEQRLDGAAIQGRTSAVPADPDAATEIDVSQCQVIS